jgi:hypothetical protein
MLRRATLLVPSAVITMLVSPASRAHAQATPLVVPSAPVYRHLEQLGAMGLIDTLILGTRPFSEREIMRRLTEAKRNLGRLTSVGGRDWAQETIAADLARYRRDGNRLLDAASAEVAGMASPFRKIPTDGNGGLDALINPLAAYREGRPIVSGGLVSFETMHSALLGSHVAVTLNPRVSAAIQDSIGAQAEFRLQSGYINTLFGGFSIEVGRDYAIFGQAPMGGLLLSSNAPALDMIRVMNDRAWRVPVVSRLFGSMRGSLFLADLGTTHQTHPHAKLIAYHLATLPSPHFELGVQVVDAMGGNGGQPATFSDRLLDAIPVVDAFRTSSDFQFSNKLAGIDLRWRMPGWRGFELYAEGNADDFDGRNLSRGFVEDAGYIFGTSFACLFGCGNTAVRAEYHQTGIRYYTHFDYPLASNGFLLGDPLGPRAVGGYLSSDTQLGPSRELSVTGAFEARSGNTYRSATTGAREEGFHFELVERRPSEKRARLAATWTRGEDSPLSVSISGGIERVWNFRFIPNYERMNVLARIAIVARP